MAATIDFTTPLSLPNGTKLDIVWTGSGPNGPYGPNDDLSEFRFTVTLRTNNATQARICTREMLIKDGISTQLQRQTTPAVSLAIEDAERYFVHTASHDLPTRSTPTGYTDLMNAWRGGSNAGNRNSALKAHLLSAAHIDSSLTGT